MKFDQSFEPLSPSQLLCRKLGRGLANALFPYTLDDDCRALDTAEAFLSEGYGLIVLMNHFSTRDSAQALALLLSNSEVMRRPILAPVAYHQHNAVVAFWTDRLAIELCPIVTADTIRELGSDFRQGDGLLEYATGALECLKKGGIILLAPQGGRRSTLGQPQGRPLGNLLAIAKRNGVDNICLLFVGLAIPGVMDYSTKMVGGANVGKSYRVNLNNVRPVEEAVRLAGGRKKIDEWAFDQLRQLVPVAYGGDLL